MFEIHIPFICLQPEILIKLIGHRFCTSQAEMVLCLNKESHTDLLHQHITFSYLPQPMTISPPMQRTWKEFLPKFRPQQDSNQEIATRLTPTRALAPLTYELWQDWCSVTISDLWSHHCEGSKKNSHHSFSFWTPGKLPYQIMYRNIFSLLSMWWWSGCCCLCGLEKSCILLHTGTALAALIDDDQGIPSPKTLALILLVTIQYTRRTPEAADPNANPRQSNEIPDNP